MITINMYKKPYGYVYEVVNNINGKNYIGQTVATIHKKWWADKKALQELTQ